MTHRAQTRARSRCLHGTPKGGPNSPDAAQQLVAHELFRAACQPKFFDHGLHAPTALGGAEMLRHPQLGAEHQVLAHRQRAEGGVLLLHVARKQLELAAAARRAVHQHQAAGAAVLPPRQHVQQRALAGALPGEVKCA